MKKLIFIVFLAFFFFKTIGQITVHPNPFITTLTITYSLTSTDTVTIEVYNTLGQIKDILINDSVINAGIDSLIYYPTTLSAGIYFVTFFTKHDTAVKKVVYQGSSSGINLNTNISPKIYPNPANNILYIEVEDVEPETKITDMFGKNILVTKNKKIDVSGLPLGVYYISIKTNSFTAMKKFIKE